MTDDDKLSHTLLESSMLSEQQERQKSGRRTRNMGWVDTFARERVGIQTIPHVPTGSQKEPSRY